MHNSTKSYYNQYKYLFLFEDFYYSNNSICNKKWLQIVKFFRNLGDNKSKLRNNSNNNDGIKNIHTQIKINYYYYKYKYLLRI